MASQPSHSLRIGHSELSLGVMEATASSCRDEELMARYQNGESAAFAEIYGTVFLCAGSVIPTIARRSSKKLFCGFIEPEHLTTRSCLSKPGYTRLLII